MLPISASFQKKVRGIIQNKSFLKHIHSKGRMVVTRTIMDKLKEISKNPAVYKFNSHLLCEPEFEVFKYGVSSAI